MISPDRLFERMLEEGEFVLDRLDHWSSTTPDKTFIHYGEDGIRLSFAEFRSKVDRLAGGIAASGLKQGEPLCVLTRNSLVSALAMFAIWRIGGIFAPINYHLTGPLLAHQVRSTKAKAVITDVHFLQVLEQVWHEFDIERLFVHVPDPEDHDYVDGQSTKSVAAGAHLSVLRDLEIGGPLPPVTRTPFSPASIIYTSGTTGPAKGVLQSFRWINQYSFTNRSLNESEDVVYCDLPLYHVGGAFHLLARACWNGSTIGLWDRFSTAGFWDRIAECGATCCTLVDVMIPRLLAAPRRPDDRSNTLNKVHIQPYNTAHRELAERFGIDFVTVGYGQSEGGSVFSGIIDEFPDGYGTPPELYRGLQKEEYRRQAASLGRYIVDGAGEIPPGFMGRPSALFDVALLDDDDMPVNTGAVGQLCLRPRFPGLLYDEYLDDPKATLEVQGNCWFHTGDACKQVNKDEDLFAFVDRMGGFFRVRGENVSSYEVESAFLTHASVKAAAAVAVPAGEGKEDDIAIFIEPHEGSTVNIAILHGHAKRNLPSYMSPRFIRIVDALPVTPTNKVEKYKLRATLLAELSSSGSDRETGT